MRNHYARSPKPDTTTYLSAAGWSMISRTTWRRRPDVRPTCSSISSRELNTTPSLTRYSQIGARTNHRRWSNATPVRMIGFLPAVTPGILSPSPQHAEPSLKQTLRRPRRLARNGTSGFKMLSHAQPAPKPAISSPQSKPSSAPHGADATPAHMTEEILWPRMLQPRSMRERPWRAVKHDLLGALRRMSFDTHAC